MKGILLRTNNDVDVIEYKDDLKELQRIINGYIEYYLIDKNLYLIIDEEGKLKCLDVNKNASKLAKYDTIVGNVLVVKTNDTGDVKTMSKDDIKNIIERLK